MEKVAHLATVTVLVHHLMMALLAPIHPTPNLNQVILVAKIPCQKALKWATSVAQ